MTSLPRMDVEATSHIEQPGIARRVEATSHIEQPGIARRSKYVPGQLLMVELYYMPKNTKILMFTLQMKVNDIGNLAGV